MIILAMWPMVQKLNSVVVVGGKSLLKDSTRETLLYDRSGGYLIPLINQILVGQSYPKKSHAPLAIILCSNWKIVEDIATLCRNLGNLSHFGFCARAFSYYLFLTFSE